MSLKDRLSTCIPTVFKCWGASWIGFLIAMVPLYIFRGLYHDMATKAVREDLLMAVFGWLASCAFLMWITWRSDAAEKTPPQNALINALITAGIYGLVWIITQGSYFFAAAGFHLVELLSGGKHALWAVILSALIWCAGYVGAICLGSLLARRRREKTR